MRRVYRARLKAAIALSNRPVAKTDLPSALTATSSTPSSPDAVLVQLSGLLAGSQTTGKLTPADCIVVPGGVDRLAVSAHSHSDSVVEASGRLGATIRIVDRVGDAARRGQRSGRREGSTGDGRKDSGRRCRR